MRTSICRPLRRSVQQQARADVDSCALFGVAGVPSDADLDARSQVHPSSHGPGSGALDGAAYPAHVGAAGGQAPLMGLDAVDARHGLQHVGLEREAHDRVVPGELSLGACCVHAHRHRARQGRSAFRGQPEPPSSVAAHAPYGRSLVDPVADPRVDPDDRGVGCSGSASLVGAVAEAAAHREAHDQPVLRVVGPEQRRPDVSVHRDVAGAAGEARLRGAAPERDAAAVAGRAVDCELAARE